jgi:mucin-19
LTTDATGTTIINTTAITTSGNQTYNDVVSLTSDSTLKGGNVSFATTVDGTQALTVNASGITAFNGIVGGSANLTSLTTDATGTTIINTTAITIR